MNLDINKTPRNRMSILKKKFETLLTTNVS